MNLVKKILIGVVVLVAAISIRPLHAAPSAQRIALENGLVVLVSEEPTLPFVTLKLLVDAGSWRDPADRAGLANLTSDALLLGAAGISTTEINRRLDYMGASLESSCERDFAALGLQTLKSHFDEGLDLFLRVLMESRFPEDELKRRMQTIAAEIQSDKDQPGVVAQKLFYRTVYDESPYGHPVVGTLESLEAIEREAVLEFYQDYYRPNASILAVVGDISMEEVETVLIPELEKWPRKEIPAPEIEFGFAEGPEIVSEQRSITQANIVLGHRGIERSNPDYYAVSVMNNILGGGALTSRLAEEIRIKRGLAYSVNSMFNAHKHPGSFQIILQTKNAAAGEAFSLCLEEMKKMQQEMVSKEELTRAKQYLIGSFPLRLSTQERLSGFWAQVEYYGLGLDYPEKYADLIEAVSREDVLRVAREYLHPKGYILTVVGNMEEITLPVASP